MVKIYIQVWIKNNVKGRKTRLIGYFVCTIQRPLTSHLVEEFKKENELFLTFCVKFSAYYFTSIYLRDTYVGRSFLPTFSKTACTNNFTLKALLFQHHQPHPLASAPTLSTPTSIIYLLLCSDAFTPFKNLPSNTTINYFELFYQSVVYTLMKFVCQGKYFIPLLIPIFGFSKLDLSILECSSSFFVALVYWPITFFC